jgi:hypothetical protein
MSEQELSDAAEVGKLQKRGSFQRDKLHKYTSDDY